MIAELSWASKISISAQMLAHVPLKKGQKAGCNPCLCAKLHLVYRKQYHCERMYWMRTDDFDMQPLSLALHASFQNRIELHVGRGEVMVKMRPRPLCPLIFHVAHIAQVS